MKNAAYMAERFAKAKAAPVPSGTKICRRCGERKPYSEFAIHGGCKDGRRPDCRICGSSYYRAHRERNGRDFFRRHEVKRRYGLTLEEYTAFANANGNKCGICGTEDPGGRWGTFCLDHCHKTGKFRGILCQKCNRGIGFFCDDIDRLRNAISYLETS